ncbi:uncharacterized protein LOC114536208 isoform X2 [Dendronephthya gigantea]|uniref:uncharacterized protein LOC114536208 isoform X2 n=1 Tax=Dendronephthya gigantea TaxID=151771 RepID=UPI001069D866|nr:uncharacterized protein LOC114536208 isoform X2 [Dendronephthya gigantea]
MICFFSWVFHLTKDKMSWVLHRWFVLFGISFLVLKDCRCFFIRHTTSGKCIAAGNPVWNDSHATRYWAELFINCLNVTAQFRYFWDTEVVHNIARNGTVMFLSGGNYQHRMLVYDSAEITGFESDPRHRMKQKSAGSLYFYDNNVNSCAQPDANDRYIMQKKNGCNDTEEQQKFTFGSVTQFGDKMKDVHCSPIQRMVIHKAHYGDFNNGGTFNFSATIDKNCSRLASCRVKSLCGGNRSCELTIDNNLLSSQYCPDTTKELYIEYTCVDNYINPITTVPNIRLSKSPNEGFIEIKNGSIWRKVKDEIWDKTREKSLCQRLGFNGAVGNVVKTKGIEKDQEIASGDLCYDASLNNACCVHLYPSTTTSTVDAPYVTCKICKNALLQNQTKFPDTVFSGGGSTNKTMYKEARFSSDGWCPTESGDKYLQIDLQNEYHITQVLVMGDKNQTKWSRSYSLKYSYNESLVEDNSSVWIKGNLNGYQLLTTAVDMYNVRYVKIQSTENTAFCFRIEICGEGQMPAPVRKIVAKPSFHSVHLSWTTPAPNVSSHITHFIIYLNGTQVDRISRSRHANKYTLRGLKPNTYYQVAIKTLDGYSRESKTVHRSVKTKRAGFFLRHTQSGKCIAAETRTLCDDGNGTWYWVEMVTNCLSDTALFRYNDNKLLHNIETEGNVVSDYGHNSDRLFIYHGKNQVWRDWANRTRYCIKQTTGRSLLLYEVNDCVQPGVHYVDVKNTSCDDTLEQKFTFGSVTQYGDKMKDVHCSPIQRMVIHKAHYGDFNNGGTFNFSATIDKNCSRLASCLVKSLCGGNRSCELTIDNNLLSSQYCPDTTKELYIEYTCVDNYTNPIKAAPNIRLSKSPSEGFVEIKDGSIWRKVKEEIWDKSRETSLCLHLGFNGAVGNVANNKGIEKDQEIASGDLCYDTSENDRCCVHLYPSTTKSTIDAPYVTCKLWADGLLQNKTKFPDTIFSGSGSTDKTMYKEARFSSDGWCPTESGDKYLQIDLQNEYHITRVVVIGDKNQTKWSGSYSLKYSHNESMLDGSTKIQIKGNLKSYQPSTTEVDIYNVGYVRVESVGKTDFCLRLELCGEVQSLAPVQNVVAKPSNFSVYLSWTIPPPAASTYITHFIIYLNGTELNRISRADYGNQYVLRGLKPYTNYVVGIKTQDGYSMTTQPIIYQNFKTKEAVPSGPPRSVVIESRSINSLEISWKAPDKVVCNVSACTKVGFGIKSLEISEITNGESINPVVISHSSLRLTIPKTAGYIREVMIIVQRTTNRPAPREDDDTNKLKLCQENNQDRYVAAYLRAELLPLSFVIGDDKEYNSENVTYVNHYLQGNTSYRVFVRFFESEKSYYSTEWSNSVRTMVTPAVFLNHTVFAQSSKKEAPMAMDLLIPVVILAVCFVLSLGVNFYQHRLLRKKNRVSNRYQTSRHTNINDVIDEIEHNEAAALETGEGPESSLTYTSLKKTENLETFIRHCNLLAPLMIEGVFIQWNFKILSSIQILVEIDSFYMEFLEIS